MERLNVSDLRQLLGPSAGGQFMFLPVSGAAVKKSSRFNSSCGNFAKVVLVFQPQQKLEKDPDLISVTHEEKLTKRKAKTFFFFFFCIT